MLEKKLASGEDYMYTDLYLRSLNLLIWNFFNNMLHNSNSLKTFPCSEVFWNFYSWYEVKISLDTSRKSDLELQDFGQKLKHIIRTTSNHSLNLGHLKLWICRTTEIFSIRVEKTEHFNILWFRRVSFKVLKACLALITARDVINKVVTSCKFI